MGTLKSKVKDWKDNCNNYNISLIFIKHVLCYMFVLFLLQTCDISARIAALKSAGLNVDPQQSRFTKTKTIPVMVLAYYICIYIHNIIRV